MEEQLCRIEKELLLIKNLLIEVLAGQVKVEATEEKIINLKEAVDFLGLEKHIVYAKCSTGEIPCFKVGKLYKFKRSELIKWMEDQGISTKNATEDFVSKYLQTHILKA